MDIATLQKLASEGIITAEQYKQYAGTEAGFPPPNGVGYEDDPLSVEGYLNSLNKSPISKSTPPPRYNTLYPASNQIDYSGSEEGLMQLGVRRGATTQIPQPTLPDTPPKILTQPTSYGSDYDAYLKNETKAGTAQSVDNLYKEGKISIEERDRLQLLSPEELAKQTTPTTEGANKDQARLNAMMRYMNPGGSDISTEMFTLGRGLGAEKGTKGKWADIIGGAGAGLFDIARNVASGIGYSKMNDYTQNYYDDLMKEKKYTNISQTDNTNNVGYTPYARDGGKFFFEEGGDMQQAVPQEGQPQDQMVQVAQQLVEGLGSLEAIDKYLKEQGTDEQSYQAIMQIAEQMLGENSVPSQEQPEAQEQPQMKGGGTFTHKVGDFVEFEHSGKTHSGRISKIENGQIFL